MAPFRPYVRGQTLDAGDASTLQRRGSRTDLDFEAALLGDGTFQLREGLDVDKLGLDSPSPRRTTPTTPATPVVVPPTPTGAAGPSRRPPSPMSDEEDPERSAYRRSMYRAPGTASSPDLATLLRKAKDRATRRDPPPPIPNQITSIAYAGNNPPPKKNKLQRIQTNGEGEKVVNSLVQGVSARKDNRIPGQNAWEWRDSPRAIENRRYSAFVLEHPKHPTCPSAASGQVYNTTPVGSPIAELFTSPRTPDTTKPLPPIMGQSPYREASDDDSLVIVDRIPRTPSPLAPQVDPPSATRQRRSMSVGEVELNKIVAGVRDHPPLSGILDEFQGQINGLAPAAPLDLRDPSTPVRRPDHHATRSKTDPTPITPLLTLQLPQSEDEDGAPIVPPRTTSLTQGSSSRDRETPRVVWHPPPSLSPLRARNGSPFGSPSSPNGASPRLRIMKHGSSASISEPSLVPVGDACEPPLSPSVRLVSSPSSSAAPKVYRSSQGDLSVNDLTLTRTPSNPLVRGEDVDPEDMDTRGKDLATRCWKEDEDFLSKEKIAEWLGSDKPVNKAALRHYVNFFDFAGLRLDLAFRRLCAKLYLKAETQQVDRILEEFSRRYWDCNPGGLYGSANIVHAVSYSLLLLNTDLHVADLATRMSRTQFVRNTLMAIQMQLQPATPAQASSTDLASTQDSSSLRAETLESSSTPPATIRSKRSDSITSWHSVSRQEVAATSTMSSPAANGSTPSVQIPMSGHEPRSSVSSFVYGRAWENDMENLLKDMYNAVKSQQILQPLNSSRSSMGSLTTGPNGTVSRIRSQRGPPDRLTTLKRGSIRGLQSILGQQANSPYSSNSSITDGRTSPSPSFATSTHEAGAYNSSSSFLTPTLGFASNLSHTIIREAQEDDDRSGCSDDSAGTDISISDEELALLGAPWAKEGMLCRKQYWESVGKRAKDKAWLDVFVVIQKGELNMFTFGDASPGASGTFGGGNWLSNARPVGTVQLAHSLAHALPSPGYNRQRPYCMVLTLANGGVYFFQAGTEELVNEWVSTCNYWAARTSKEPLAGGVSNMEYGWNRLDDSGAHGRAHSTDNSSEAPDVSDVMSVRSGRSTRSKFGWREGAATVRGTSPWADRTFVNDWKPPLPPTVASPHDEETQLDALRKHVVSMKRELKQHNEYREPMAALYQPRSSNAVKAQSNWEKKSQYLLTEIVKYDSYIDSLQAAMSLRLKKRGEKALERALNGHSAEDPKAKWKGPEEETIHEDDEPLYTGQSRIRVEAPSTRDG
ncbi:Sec7-like domain belongs to guanine nucleotide exchange factors [Mycena sanguinolenta]|uniref:Sec7-like domain belongs to guanine nucleotide exchange factors n=1 Tax=Mycena sanguinolenta TaxID=230812 RepID=A0A8H6ZIE7_9AGAR|nr:Sec7-like domain belongs to guanine nucleotide exchange factors [Mycena sanguinolenta]